MREDSQRGLEGLDRAERRGALTGHPSTSREGGAGPDGDPGAGRHNASQGFPDPDGHPGISVVRV